MVAFLAVAAASFFALSGVIARILPNAAKELASRQTCWGSCAPYQTCPNIAGVDCVERSQGFSVRWNNTAAPFIAGKGWVPAGPRGIITYSATLNTTGDVLLAIYGVSDIAEWYIVESFGTWDPMSMMRGTLSTDGGTYRLGVSTKDQLAVHPTVSGGSYQQAYSRQRHDRRLFQRLAQPRV